MVDGLGDVLVVGGGDSLIDLVAPALLVHHHFQVVRTLRGEPREFQLFLWALAADGELELIEAEEGTSHFDSGARGLLVAAGAEAGGDAVDEDSAHTSN
jgi:hypothetical protein